MSYMLYTLWGFGCFTFTRSIHVSVYWSRVDRGNCRCRAIGRLLILLKASVMMGELSVRIVVPMAMKKPKVAADPIIYCPSVRSIPLGPGPKRTMLVKPKMKPMIKPTAPPIMPPIFNLSRVEGPRPCAPCGIDPTGTGMATTELQQVQTEV